MRRTECTKNYSHDIIYPVKVKRAKAGAIAPFIRSDTVSRTKTRIERVSVRASEQEMEFNDRNGSDRVLRVYYARPDRVYQVRTTRAFPMNPVRHDLTPACST